LLHRLLSTPFYVRYVGRSTRYSTLFFDAQELDYETKQPTSMALPPPSKTRNCGFEKLIYIDKSKGKSVQCKHKWGRNGHLIVKPTMHDIAMCKSKSLLPKSVVTAELQRQTLNSERCE
jgi:hypothetical protein